MTPTTLSRGLKAVLSFSGATGLQPTQELTPDQIASGGQDAAEVLRAIDGTLKALDAYQSTPGTPAAQITHGLAPSDPAVEVDR